jgi:hypothetical protein
MRVTTVGLGVATTFQGALAFLCVVRLMQCAWPIEPVSERSTVDAFCSAYGRYPNRAELGCEDAAGKQKRGY